MNIYTRGGDSGRTSLMNGSRVAKYDDRIELLGTIDELSSHIGLAKVIANAGLAEKLAEIQRNLMQIMAGIADSRNRDYRFDESVTAALEKEIDEIESSFPRAKEFILYGGCEQSARLDVARAVARRAERLFWKVSQKYGADHKAIHYLNRLSDYLYMEARRADYLAGKDKNEELRQNIIKNIMNSTNGHE